MVLGFFHQPTNGRHRGAAAPTQLLFLKPPGRDATPGQGGGEGLTIWSIRPPAHIVTSVTR